MDVQPETSQDEEARSSPLGIGLILILLLISLAVLSLFYKRTPTLQAPQTIKPSPAIPQEKVGFKAFKSKEDFKQYLTKARGQTEVELPGLDAGARVELREMAPKMGAPQATQDVFRVSQTNVQVLGIDEPDIVKTNGKEIYFSPQTPGVYPMVPPMRMMDERELLPMPIRKESETKVIRAFPPNEAEMASTIQKNGDLIVFAKYLVILSREALYGYDISNPDNPTEKWKLSFKQNHQLVQARLFDGKMYLVTQSAINYINPCPITPLELQGSSVSIPCIQIYRPDFETPVDVTYSAMVVDPETGLISKKISFVGSSQSSVLYMSRNALYLAYGYNIDISQSYYQFFLEEGRDLISGEVLQELRKVAAYELSGQAKQVEFQRIISQYEQSLDQDEKLRFENQFNNRQQKYLINKKRQLEKTAIVKVDLNRFGVSETGTVPGRLLNQFSLDEYSGYLRAATSVGGSTFDARQSGNDLYVLDKNLNLVGSLVDLGVGERIYSVRFMGEKAFLVTFRQTDPFFVLDLSDARNPKLKGQLKIPGYSSYLHPIDRNHILGIGKEGAYLKISLFDVSLPDDPQEVDKYILKEYDSDILQTHRAFLMDRIHAIFFLPGNQGGYVFSYKGSKLELIKAVDARQTRRALYINNYLYILSDTRLTILDENSWETVNAIDF